MSAPIQAALLGVLQGVTEFLPISSTAHLLIAARLIGFDDPGSVFTEMIQLGSILAVMWLYRARIVWLARGFRTDPGARRLLVAIAVAFAPAAVVGLAAASYVEEVLHHNMFVIAVAFIVGGAVMLIVERIGIIGHVREVEGISARQGLGIGLVQVTALVPGVSRSGATIIGGLLAGLDRGAAAEFSFFLAMPTMIATFMRSLFGLRAGFPPERALDLVIGFVAAFIASAVVVRPFLAVVRRSGFAPFAWYRIAAGLLLFAVSLFGSL